MKYGVYITRVHKATEEHLVRRGHNVCILFKYCAATASWIEEGGGAL